MFQSDTTDADLISGVDGPAASMQGNGFDRATRTHVEGHAAAIMRREGIAYGRLYINNPEICGSCARLLPRMLPPGSTLDVVLPNGGVVSFRGAKP